MISKVIPYESSLLCLKVDVTTPCSGDGTCIPELSRTEVRIRWDCNDSWHQQNHRYVFGDGTVSPWTTDSGIMVHDFQESGVYMFRATTQRVGSPNDTLTYTETITIEEESSVASIGVTPGTASLRPGQTVLLTATPRDQSGNIVSGETVSWSSSNASVRVTPRASNRNKADVTSQIAATSLITAAIGTVEGTSSVQFVSPNNCPSIHHVQVAVTNGVINVGQTTNLQAIPKDAFDNTLSSTGCTISWSSTSQVTVSQDSQYPYLATATGASAGTATVTANVNGIQGSTQITVGSPPAGDNAQPYGVGNSFPPTMYQGQFYAVSVYMENSGGTTWTPSSYTLKRVTGNNFDPSSVALSQNVSPGTNHPFTFNLYNDAPYGQAYNVQYKMHRSGTGTFGLANGGWIDVLDPAGCTKNCGPSAFLSPTYESHPGGALYGDMRPRFSSSTEANGILQTLVVEDYPLHFFADDGSQVAYIRYFGALAEPWSVDVTFRLTFEPGTIHIGQLKKALALTGYDLEILTMSANELVVKLNRQSANSALPTDRVIFLEMPLLAVSGETPPATLPRVELIVER